jgi:hypothetical protein
MKSKLLLPPKAKWIGLTLFLPAFILGFAFLIFNYEIPFLNVDLKNWMFIIKEEGMFNSTNNNLTDEVALVFTVIGLLLITFSREKTEDEFIQKIRMESFQWSVLVNYILLLLCTLFIYGSSFFIAMVANLLTVLIIFNIRFHWILFSSKSKKEA